MKRTLEQWSIIHNVFIMDPDGWREQGCEWIQLYLEEYITSRPSRHRPASPVEYLHKARHLLARRKHEDLY